MDKNPIGCGFGCDFVSAGGYRCRFDYKPDGFFLAGIKILYPCPHTYVPAMDVCVCICVCIYVYIIYIHICIFICVYLCAHGFVVPLGSE
jgi:hypothetical protein